MKTAVSYRQQQPKIIEVKMTIPGGKITVFTLRFLYSVNGMVHYSPEIRGLVAELGRSLSFCSLCFIVDNNEKLAKVYWSARQYAEMVEY